MTTWNSNSKSFILRAIIAFALISTAFGGSMGCTNPFEPIAAPKELIPLKVGNEWRYELANYLPAINDTLYRQFTSQIIRDTVINGKKHFFSNTVGGNFFSSIVINYDDGYYIWRNGKYWLLNKYPIQLGSKYQFILFDFQNMPVDTIDVEVIKLNTTVTVKAGTFQCYTEQYRLGSLKYHRSLAAGYGTIQELIFDSTNTELGRVQLLSYTIQK